MKITAHVSLLRVALSVLALLYLSSCVTPASEKLTLHQTYLQVQRTWMQFQNLSTAGNVTSHQKVSIEEDYREFKAAYDAAVKAVGGDEHARTTPAPNKVKAAAEKLMAQVEMLL